MKRAALVLVFSLAVRAYDALRGPVDRLRAFVAERDLKPENEAGATPAQDPMTPEAAELLRDAAPGASTRPSGTTPGRRVARG